MAKFLNDIIIQGEDFNTSLSHDLCDISTWQLHEDEFYSGSQEANGEAIFFKPDGTKMYIAGRSGDDVNEYALSTAWDVTTASFTDTLDGLETSPASESNPYDMYISPDGIYLYIVGHTTDQVIQYTMSTAWDISTASYTREQDLVIANGNDFSDPIGINFKSDGTMFWVVSQNSDAIQQYTLSTPWNISTLSVGHFKSLIGFFTLEKFSTDENNYSLGSIESIWVSEDGTKIWMSGSAYDTIHQLKLSTAFNITTATYDGSTIRTSSIQGDNGGLYVNETVGKAFTVAPSGDFVRYYNFGGLVFNNDNEGGVGFKNGVGINGSLTVNGLVNLQGRTSLYSADIHASLNTYSTTSLTHGNGGTVNILDGTTYTGIGMVDVLTNVHWGRNNADQNPYTNGNIHNINLGRPMKGGVINLNIGRRQTGNNVSGDNQGVVNIVSKAQTFTHDGYLTVGQKLQVTGNADLQVFDLGGTVIFSDTFTETNTTDLASHTPDTGAGWTKVFDSGTAQAWNVIGGTGVASASVSDTSDGMIYLCDTLPTVVDYEIKVDFLRKDSGDDTFHIIFKYKDADNFFHLQWSASYSGYCKLRRKESGSFVEITNFDYGVNNATTDNQASSLKVRFIDNKIMVWDIDSNGYQAYRGAYAVTDFTNDGNGGTFHKFGMGIGAIDGGTHDQTTTWKIDKFEVKQLSSAATLKASTKHYIQNGLVGIGTSSPAQLLHVFGGAATIEIDSTTNESVLNFDNSTTTANIKLANNDLKTELGGSEKMRILANGNVGIGTTSPSHKITVPSGTSGRVARLGNLEITTQAGTYTGSSIEVTGSNSFIKYNSTLGHKFFTRVQGGGNTLEAFTIASDTGNATFAGDVGIGITPVSNLHVYENSSGTGTGSGITVENDGTGDAIVQYLLTGTKRWVTGIDNSDGDNFKIASSADLGTDTEFVLDSSGNGSFAGTVTGTTFIGALTGTASNAALLDNIDSNQFAYYNSLTFADSQEKTNRSSVFPAPGRSTTVYPASYQRTLNLEFKSKNTMNNPGTGSSWLGIMSMAPYATGGSFYTNQIAMGADGTNSDLFIRRGNGTGNGTWGDWRQIITSDSATFTSNLTVGSNSLTAGSLDINGTADIDGKLNVASVATDYVAKFSHTTATGYAPGSILLQAGQGASRGQGLFHYNTVADDSWFTGVPYNVNSTKWIVAHKADTTFNPDVAQTSHAIFTLDSSNDLATFAGALTVDGSVFTLTSPDAGSAPAMTATLNMRGYEGRGIGIKMRPHVTSAANATNAEWFMGSGYGQSGFNVGYAADGSQSSYAAQSKLTIGTNGDATFAGELTIPGYINHAGDSGTKFGFEGNDAFRLYTASTMQLQIDSAGNATFAGHIIPAADNTYDLGTTNSLDFRTLYVRNIEMYNQRVNISSTGTLATIADHTSVGDGIRFSHLGAEILRLGNRGSTDDTAATFAGNINSGAITALAKGTQFSSTGYYVGSTFKDVADNCGVILGHNDTANGVGVVAGINQLAFLTYGSAWVQALLLDGSQNATFAGTIGSGTITSTGTIKGQRLQAESSTFPQQFIIDTTSGGGNSRTMQIGMSGSSLYFKKSDATGSIIFRNSNNTNLMTIGLADAGQVTVLNELEAGSLDINGNADISGTLTGGNVFAKGIYCGGSNTSNGFLIETNISTSNYAMLHGTIKLEQFNFNTFQTIEFSATTINNGTVGTKAGKATTSITIKLFNYNNKWYVWVPQPSSYTTCTAFIGLAYSYQGQEESFNEVENVSHNAVPSSGVSNSVDLVCSDAVVSSSLDINGNADISGTLDVAGDTTIANGLYVQHDEGIQIGDTANASTSKTTLTSANASGNSQMKIKGGNFLHQVHFETSKNDFRYANLTASYNGGDSSFNLYKSNSDTTGTAATTTISTGASTFAGDVILSGTAPTLRIQDSRNLNNGDWDNVSLGNIEFYSSDTTSPGARVMAEIEAFSNNAAASGPNSDLIFKTSANTDSSPQTRLTIGYNGTSTFAGNVTAGSNSLTAGSLDINGNADISGNLVIAGTVDGVDISGLPTSFAPTNAEANVAPTTAQVKTALNADLGTVTFGDSNDQINFPGNITVTGVTTMSGGTVVNTTTNTAIKDTTIVLNTGIGDSAPNAADIGLIFDRGNLGNTFMGWDESEDEFIFAKTSTEGSTDVSAAAGGGIAIANEAAYLAVKAGSFEAVGSVTANGVTLTGTQSSVSGNAGSVTNGVYTIGDQSIAGKKSFAGPTKIEQTWFYDMTAGSLNTTGYACAGLSSGGNGASATFIFDCGGGAGNAYQRIVYNCWNVQGTWNTSKNIDEGGNKFDVTASANGSTITFTFKSRSGTQYYTPRVHVQAMGQSIVTTY